MDGPNVNWHSLKLHSSYREQNEFSKLINIGSCAFHVLQGALQTELIEPDWEINKVENMMNHGEIFISGKVVVIFFLCFFARLDGLRVNPLLHKEFRYGKVFSRLWSTGFHVKK